MKTILLLTSSLTVQLFSADALITTRDGKCQLIPQNGGTGGAGSADALKYVLDWSGQCIGGKLSGTGTLRFYARTDGALGFVEEILPDSGISWVAGDLVANVDPKSAEYALTCSQPQPIFKDLERPASLTIYVPTNIDLYFSKVLIPFMKEGEMLVAQRCLSDFQRAHPYAIDFGFARKPRGAVTVLHAHCDNSPDTFKEFECLKRSTIVNQDSQPQNKWAQTRREQSILRAERQKQQNIAQANAISAKTELFLKTAGSREVVSLGNLCQNPFPYVGKIVVFSLVSPWWRWIATSATSASVDAASCVFSLVGIPSSVLTPKFNSDKVIAAKVLGKPQGMVSLQYVNHEQCSSAGCSDFPTIVH